MRTIIKRENITDKCKMYRSTVFSTFSEDGVPSGQGGAERDTARNEMEPDEGTNAAGVRWRGGLLWTTLTKSGDCRICGEEER